MLDVVDNFDITLFCQKLPQGDGTLLPNSLVASATK